MDKIKAIVLPTEPRVGAPRRNINIACSELEWQHGGLSGYNFLDLYTSSSAGCQMLPTSL